MKATSFALALTWVLFLCACDDTTDSIGTSLVDRLDNVEISTDIFPVASKSIKAGTLLSNNITAYLGKIKDPETGAFITGNCMLQFHALDNALFPPKDSIVSKNESGEIIADSCDVILYYQNFYGDSLATMKVKVYELEKPMLENTDYYTDFDPLASGYVRQGGLVQSQVYTAVNKSISQHVKDSIARTSSYVEHFRIPLNQTYSRDQKAYNNFGSFLLNAYYANETNFSNPVKFLKNIMPGFYFKNDGGLGSMVYISAAKINVYYRYKALDTNNKSVEFPGVTSFYGTEEVLQTSNFYNDDTVLDELVKKEDATYLKTPAGLFTELTLPVESIMEEHTADSLNLVKLEIPRINEVSSYSYAFKAPQTLLMVPKDSVKTFFANKYKPNSKTSFIATLSSENTYVFNNVANLISAMYRRKKSSADWNKAVLIPITLSTTSLTGVTTNGVYHDFSVTGTRLVKGTSESDSPLKVSVIYSKFK